MTFLRDSIFSLLCVHEEVTAGEWGAIKPAHSDMQEKGFEKNFMFLFRYLWDRVLIYNLDWSGTHSVLGLALNLGTTEIMGIWIPTQPGISVQPLHGEDKEMVEFFTAPFTSAPIPGWRETPNGHFLTDRGHTQSG